MRHAFGVANFETLQRRKGCAQHRQGHLRNAADFDIARQHRRAPRKDAARLQRDLLGLVADPLQVGGDLDHGHQHAQVAAGRLPPRDDLPDQRIDLHFERVDQAFMQHDLVDQGFRPAAQRLDGVDHLALHADAQLQDAVVGQGQLLLIV